MDRRKVFFRWKVQADQYAQIINVSSYTAAYSGTPVKPELRGLCDTGESGSWKTWHGGPHNSARGGRNKAGGYIIVYAPGIDRNKTAEG